MKVGMDIKAYEKLDSLVDKINKDGVNRTILFRDVVIQLVSKLSKSDARELIAEKRLEYSLDEVLEVSGPERLTEVLESYIVKIKE
jgi:hypothetical protein